MHISRKKNLLLIILGMLIIILLGVIIYYNYRNDYNKVVINDNLDSLINSNALTMMYETGQGSNQYQVVSGTS